MAVSKRTETVYVPDGGILDEWSFLKPLYIERDDYDDHLLEPIELRDMADTIAETDDDFMTLCNGMLNLIATGETVKF